MPASDRLPHHARVTTTAALTAAALLGPAPAVAAPAAPRATTTTVATATLALSGAGLARVQAAGVRVFAGQGATRTGALLTLPASRASVGLGATLHARGRLTFRAGPRTATFTTLRVTASTRRAQLTGLLGGRRTVLAAGRPALGALTADRARQAATLAATQLTLGATAARTLQRVLKLTRTPAGILGSLRLSVPGRAPGGAPSSPAPSPGAPAPAPATTLPITSATIVWHVRDSFVQYTASGEGTTASAGATADPRTSGCTSAGAVNDAQLAYQFRFPFTGGTYDTSTGRARLSFTGTVNFRYAAHTIDLDMSDPELSVGGAGSQASFRFDGRDGTDLRGVRAPLVDLGLTAPRPKQCAADPGPLGLTNAGGVVNADGTRTVTLERLPGAVAKEAGRVFDTAGFGYPPGDPFGWITVTYTVAAPAA